MGEDEEFANKWAAVAEHEAHGRPAPVLEEGQYEPWCVIDLTEDDPPVCTCDMEAQAVMIAKALNLAEFHYWLFAGSVLDGEEETNE